jgi:hypothetical protein
MSTVAKRLARHFAFGRSRVLTPVAPDQVWVFFKGFPTPSHRGISHIKDTANAGSVSNSQYQYHLPSAPILTVPTPILPVSVAENALESLSSPPPFGGRMKDVSFPFSEIPPTFAHALSGFVSFLAKKCKYCITRSRSTLA